MKTIKNLKSTVSPFPPADADCLSTIVHCIVNRHNACDVGVKHEPTAQDRHVSGDVKSNLQT